MTASGIPLMQDLFDNIYNIDNIDIESGNVSSWVMPGKWTVDERSKYL